MSDLWGRYPIVPASQGRVSIGDSLRQAWGQTLQVVPIEGGARAHEIRDRALLPTGTRQGTTQMPFLPSGLNEALSDTAMRQLFSESQLFTLTYDHAMTADPDDEKYELVAKQLRQAAATNDTTPLSVPGVGAVIIQPAFWDYVKRKQDQEMETAFRFWRFQQMNNTEPAERAWWVAHTPDFIPKVKAGQKRQMKLMKKISDIRIFGIQSEEDLRFLFECGTGINTADWERRPPVESSVPPGEFVVPQLFPGNLTTPGNTFPGVRGPDVLGGIRPSESAAQLAERLAAAALRARRV